MSDAVINKITELLREYTSAPVTESSHLYNELGMDSFYILHFLSEVEDTFHIHIAETEYEEVLTVNDVLELIRYRKNQTRQGHSAHNNVSDSF